jgi:predicted transcriptional regulator
MAPQYQTLQTIYDIVKNDPQPTTYLCSTRDIILRQVAGWSSIEKHLELLEKEGLIVIKKLDRVVVCITSTGIEAIQTLTQHQPSDQT